MSKRKRIIASILGVIGILSTGAAETLATPLVVEQGFYFTHQDFVTGGISNFDQATFSGDHFAVFNLGTHEVDHFEDVFITGVLDVETGLGSHGTLQVGNVSCQITNEPDCSAALRFIHAPLTIPPNFPGGVVGEVPFTMTGQLGLSNLRVDIEGSGMVTGTVFTDIDGRVTGSNAQYTFAPVPEPSTIVLMLSGLVAIGWRRKLRQPPILTNESRAKG
jgi:hypothetical protein